MQRPVAKDKRWVGKTEEFLKLFSVKMGDMKIYFGQVNNSTVMYVRDAVSYCQEHCHDYRIRQKVKYIWSWLSMLEYRLKTHPVGFFRPESIAESMRQHFRDDISESDLYDYWITEAGKSYTMLYEAAGVLRHKFELIFKDWGVKEYKTIAYLSTAQWLLQDQQSMYDHCVEKLSDTLGLTKDSTKYYLSPFDLHGLNEAVTKLVKTIYPDADKRTASERERHILQLAWEQIENVFANPDFIWDGFIEAAADDEDIFKTNGFRKKMQITASNSKAEFIKNYEIK